MLFVISSSLLVRVYIYSYILIILSVSSLSGPCVSPSLPLDGTHSHQGKSSKSSTFFPETTKKTSRPHQRIKDTVSVYCEIGLPECKFITLHCQKILQNSFWTSSCNPNKKRFDECYITGFFFIILLP